MDAAAILIPASPPESHEGSAPSTTTPTSNGNCPASSVTSATPLPEQTADYLIRVSCEFINRINERDFEGAETMQYLIDHSRFTAKLTDFPVNNSYQDHVNQYKFVYSQAPDVFLQIGDTNADIDEQKGLASVYINVNAAGQPGGVATQGVSLLEWHRIKQDGREKWLCTKHTAIKGLEDII